jgi:hypothetical protein
MTQNHQGDMMKALLLLSAVAATSVAATLSGQATTARPDSTCTKYSDGRVQCRVIRGGLLRGDSAFGSRIFYRMDSVMAKRAALGLELRTTGTRRDTLGVFVEAVTPKGPAEAAGIVEGDRVAAINGVDLRTSAADVDDSYTNEIASHRLTREVQKLTPGSRVNLRIYSGGRFRDVGVVAGKASDVMRLGNRFNIRVPGPEGMMPFDGPGVMMLRPGMPLMRERVDPLMRERLQNLRSQIQFHGPVRVRTLSPGGVPRTIRVERGVNGELQPAGLAVLESPADDGLFLDTNAIPDLDDDMFLDVDDDPLEIENMIEPVAPEVIRELAATAIRDAQSALKKLAADGVL